MTWPPLALAVAVMLLQFLPTDPKTGEFALCRLIFRQVRTEPNSSGWATDYPLADFNLSLRLGEITRLRMATNSIGEPAHKTVRLIDPELWTCRILLVSDLGTVGWETDEPRRLRDYLLKGGFLWSDDTWGPEAWAQIEAEMAKVFRWPLQWVPAGHPIYRSYYWLDAIPQVPNAGFWAGTHETSERGELSRHVEVKQLVDPRGRMMALFTHNTDVADVWEREANSEFFAEFGAVGYATGVNVVLYALTH